MRLEKKQKTIITDKRSAQKCSATELKWSTAISLKCILLVKKWQH